MVLATYALNILTNKNLCICGQQCINFIADKTLNHQWHGIRIGFSTHKTLKL